MTTDKKDDFVPETNCERLCICADPENCTETVPGYTCRAAIGAPGKGRECQSCNKPCEHEWQAIGCAGGAAAMKCRKCGEWQGR